jgi:hypothetical protein
LAEPWIYPYTDFGEGAGKLERPVLRAVVQVGTPEGTSSFAAIVDTGGPLTVVARGVLLSGGDPVDTGRTMLLRLAGASNEVPLYELTLEIRPPNGSNGVDPIQWRSVVAVLSPWPHQGTAIILGQSGFIENFTVTFGPSGFAVESADAFAKRYGQGGG